MSVADAEASTSELVVAPVADAALVSFLSGRDAPCPACGYNLRGVEASRCPECGGPLELTLGRRRRLGGWGPFLLLVFGWLLAAGGMNTARQVSVLNQMRAAQARQGSSLRLARMQLQAQIKNLQKQPARDPFAGMDDGFPGMAQMREFQAQAERDMNAMLAQQLQAQLARMPAPAVVAAPTLLGTRGGGAGSVRVGTAWAVGRCGRWLLGLGLLGVMAWRGGGPVRGLVVGACVLFACYGAWHIVLFVNEMR